MSLACTRKPKKFEKKATPKKTKTKTITKSSDSGSEDAQRKRLITPTSTVMHRYMQPTLAHSLRYGNTQTTQMLTDIATPLTARSPVPPSTQPKETIEEKFVLDEDSFRNLGDDVQEHKISADVDDNETQKLIDFNEDIGDKADKDTDKKEGYGIRDTHADKDTDDDKDSDDDDDDDDDDEDRSRKAGDAVVDDYGATVRKEAAVLIDHVLEESVNIISSQQQQQQQQQEQHESNGYDSLRQEYNSESENYAITCDDIGGLDVVKSPTIESMSGKSFDDNMSFTDEQWHFSQQHTQVTTATTGVTTTTITTTTQQQQQQQQPIQLSHDLLQFKDDFELMPTVTEITTTTRTITTSREATIPGGSGGGGVGDDDGDAAAKLKAKEDPTVTKSRRIDHKFEKLTTHAGDIDEQASAFDANFDAMVHDDELSNLQSEFSKMSWDDSVSPTTNTLGDIGQNTPDNDIQDIATETGFEFAKSSETTPVPTGATTTTAPTSSDADAPTPRPRGAGAKPASPVRDIVAGDIAQCLKSDDATSLQTDSAEILSDLSSTAPVPKPRLQMKPTDSFKNLAALASEHSDSISLRSLDMTEDLSKTDEPSTEISIKSSHARDYPTTTTITTTTTASEDHTESLEPTSEISVDDADTEKSELVDGRGKTSFYIGESSRNIIVKTTPTKPDGDLDASEDTTAAAENVAEATIEAKDIALMKEVSVDSDESNDIFKEYVTMKRETGEADSKIVRQGSETRNDLLEQEPLKEKPTDEDKVSTTFMVTAEISQPFAEEFENILKKPEAFFDDSLTPKSEKFDLQLEKSEWETAEKEIPVDGKPKVVHSPQQLSELPKALIDEEMVARTLEEAQESLNAAKNELKFIVKDGKSIKESPSEFEFRSISQAFSSAEKKEKSMPEADPTPKAAQPQEREFAEMADISSFIGIPDTLKDTTALSAYESAKETTELLFDGTTKETLNKEAVMAHYAREIFEEVKQEGKDEHGSLGFISTGTADDYSSMEDYAAKEEHASLGFVSTETVEDFSSMEDYFQEKMTKASVVTVEGGPVSKSPIEDTTVGSATVFSEISSEQTMKPFEQVTHRIKSESSSTDSTNRWSVPEIDQSSSSESYYKSLDKNDSRPLSSDVDNLLTQGNSSEYQTALDMSSVTRETTEYVSAVSTLQSSSGKTISSHESMKSLDSQSETSANLGSIDVSELSETLVASSTEPDALEAEELAHIRDLRADDEDSDDSLEIQNYAKSEQQMQRSLMKRSQEMIFKPKPEETKTEEQQFETITVEEFPKPKEVERTWGLAYPVDEGKLDDVREPERPEDILLYHGDIRRSIDDSKLASSLDEGSILSVSMSSTSNIETVVENFEDMIGSAGSSSLTGIEAFGFPHDEQPSSFYEHEETFSMEMESKEHSPPDSAATTPPGEARKRGHRRSESTAITGDVLKSITDKELPVLGENKESESESDTDPYESEYTRQFRSPSERKNNKKKKQAAAEMDHSFELEKRPFTPSQLVAEVIVEDSATEEMEAEAIEEERRPSQNMQDYSVIPDITVTEDFQKSPSLEETADGFEEKSLYKVKTQEELHKAADVPLHEQKRAEKSEETFQKLVQEQYKQKLADLQRPQVGDSDYDDDKAPDSPDSFEMVDQPDISDDFVIIEEVAKEANEVDLGAKSIQIQPTKYESKHDEDVEKIIIKSAPADPKLGSQIFRDDLNFEFEESPPTAGSSSDPQEESDSGDMATSNKRWVEMQLTDTQLRYPYDITGGVLEDIKEEDGEFEVGSSRISSFKDSFSSTPEYDVMAARRYYARGEHDDVSMSSLQEFESLEQAISLENRNKTHQGSTDSSNGSFTRRYMVRHSGSGTAQGDDISISSLKEFEGLENACIEAHLIEIKAKEEAALLSRSDDSNKSNDSDRENGASAVVVSKVTRTVTRTEMLPAQQQNIEALLKQKLEECEGRDSLVKITEVSTEPLEAKIKLDKQDSEKGSVDSLEINKSLDMRSSSIGSFEISKDATTRSDIDSLETDRKQPTREESIDSMENEQFDLLARFPIAGETTLGEGLTTTTTTTTTTTDAEGHEHIVTQTVTTTTSTSGNITLEFPSEQLPKDVSTDSLCIEQTNTSSAGTTATYQTSAGNSQMSGSVTSCASSTLMEDSYPGAHSSLTSSSFWSHEESTVVEDKNVLEEVLLEDAEALKRRQVQQRSDYDDQH
ncbi:platelet binding protein GspB-like isoform X1 [Rhagoletis pomonella]|uniref:platelet binding protein GspB-like isoform X1 n=1 Tax=Rhagoletis pomonella TaxID=28610 RepID=UPI0017833993|nr:platelet binding protein GspB-like isoform X1 [Rhagoletis pomonella]